MTDPTQLYSVESTEWFRDLDIHRLPWEPLGSFRVSLKRGLERKMLQSNYKYPHGRIGAEIAYSIAGKKLNFRDPILNDPSAGGADIITTDGRVIFESRLLTITEAMSRMALERQIVFETQRLIRRLRSDLAFYPSAELGFAFLSFIGLDGLETMVFELKS